MANRLISRTDGIQCSNPPTSLLEVLNNTVADAERTQNATALMRGASQAVARVTAVTAMVMAATVTLAALLIRGMGLEPSIGGVVATTGSVLAWGIPSAWRSAKRARSQAASADAATVQQTSSTT